MPKSLFRWIAGSWVLFRDSFTFLVKLGGMICRSTWQKKVTVKVFPAQSIQSKGWCSSPVLTWLIYCKRNGEASTGQMGTWMGKTDHFLPIFYKLNYDKLYFFKHKLYFSTLFSPKWDAEPVSISCCSMEVLKNNFTSRNNGMQRLYGSTKGERGIRFLKLVGGGTNSIFWSLILLKQI